MNESGRARSSADFDRPLLRLVWVVPAAAGLWVLIVVGFFLMLGNLASAPTVKPLEVSLADLGRGEIGGSPGSGAGAKSGGSNGRHTGLLQSGAPAAVKYPQPIEQETKAAAAVLRHLLKRRRAMLPKPSTPSHPSRRQKIDDNGTRQGTAQRLPAPAEDAPPRAGPGQPEGTAMASIDGGTAQTGLGSGAGNGGAGSGGEGTGNGGAVGGGSQVYAAVEYPPVPISRVLPQYPGVARSEGVEGEVVLRAIVDRNGAVEHDVVVVQSVPLLDQAAIEALRRWRFEPGRDAGRRAVRVVIEVPLRFRLR